MSNVVAGTQVAVVFVWLGMVIGISFIETPLKFRAPGMTVALAVGIGRLVFRALNAVECAFAVVLIWCAAMGVAADSPLSLGALAAVCFILLIAGFLLRPLMDRRVQAGTPLESRARRGIHVWYILLEGAKVILLLVLGVTYLRA